LLFDIDGDYGFSVNLGRRIFAPILYGSQAGRGDDLNATLPGFQLKSTAFCGHFPILKA